MLFTSIAVQLAQHSPALRQRICAAVAAHPTIVHKMLHEQSIVDEDIRVFFQRRPGREVQNLVDKFVTSLLANNELRKLLHMVDEGEAMDKFERAFAQILVTYANELRAEAHESVEMMAADLVLVEARSVASQLRWNIELRKGEADQNRGGLAALESLECDPTVEDNEKVHGATYQAFLGNPSVGVEKHTDDGDYDPSVDGVEEISVPKRPNLGDMRKFLFGSMAFQQLIVNVTAFVFSEDNAGSDDREGSADPADSATAVTRLRPSNASFEPGDGVAEDHRIVSVPPHEPSSNADSKSCLDSSPKPPHMLFLRMSSYFRASLSVAAHVSRNLLRPRLRQGHQRIEWRCVSVPHPSMASRVVRTVDFQQGLREVHVRRRTGTLSWRSGPTRRRT
jgi:hypothetical protein